MDPTTRRSGYSPATGTFQSLRPSVPLPSPSSPLSLTSYLLSTSPPTSSFLSPSLSLPSSSLLSLSSLSLSKSDLAFILAPSSPYIPLLYLSLLRIGVVISPANPLSSPQEIDHMFRLVKPKVCFVTSDTVRQLPLNSCRVVVIDSDEFQSMLRTHEDSDMVETRVNVLPSDPAAVLFSSGTTGRVKAAVLTHGNFIAVAATVRAEDKEVERASDSPRVCLIPVPLFHVFGVMFIVRVVALGEIGVLIDRFDFVKMLEMIERYRVNYMPVSPPLVVAMVKSDVVKKYDLSSLELVGCGGAPLGKDIAERFAKKFPNVEITQGYGLTESTAGVTRTKGQEENRVFGSAGRLVPNAEAKIVDPTTGEVLGLGQRGELWLRGPTIMKGYLGDTEATASTLDSEGWLKTGDLCYFDDDGFLYIVDRLKELIKYKAYQVPPAELEHILHSHPEVLDAAVIPYPDEEAGEVPMAFVVRQPGSNLDEKQVMEFVAKQVSPYKKIRRVSFVDVIPKSAAGKILRRELVKIATSGSKSKL